MIRTVYIVGPAGSDSPVKVGVSDDAVKRLSDLQIGSPVDLVLHHALHYPAHFAQTIESAAHKALAGHHRRGEWHDITADEAKLVVERVAAVIMRNYRPYPNFGREDLLNRIGDAHPLSPWAVEAIGEYRQLQRGADNQAELARLKALVVAEMGVGALVGFEAMLSNRWALNDALGHKSSANMKARKIIAQVINVISEDYASRKEDDILGAIEAA